MNIRKRNMINVLLTLGGLLFSLYGMATCTINPGAQTVTAPLQYRGSFTVGSENSSSQLYNQLTQAPSVSFVCTGTGMNRKMTVTGTLASGYSNVYETGVPGIGIKFVGLNGDSTGQLTAPYTAIANRTGLLSLNVHAIFVRTGIVGSGTVTGASLPVIRQYIGDSNGDVLFYTLNYSGSVPVVAATCRTPDFTYALGTFGSGSFSGVNSATSWVSTAIRLDSCSPFYGYMSGGYLSWTAPGGASGSAGQTMSQNVLSLSLAPKTPVINSASGIIGLDTSGATAARGIGIQLGIQSGGSAYTPLNLGTPVQVSPALNDVSGVVQFNLGARYIQTESTITPGTANASVVYTINYQ